MLEGLTMTAEEFKAIRLSVSTTQRELAAFLGYASGEPAIAKIEAGRSKIIGPVQRLMEIIRDSGGRIMTMTRAEWEKREKWTG
jgi:DNA-binding transcriptional regulator YiaG